MKRIMKTIAVLWAIFILGIPTASGQPVCSITCYDEHSGLAHWRVTQMLQTDDGMMWFSTWNGLDRFDGSAFTNFKAEAGHGTVMPNDRLRDIRLSPDGDVCCLSDEEWFVFRRSDGTFAKASQELQELFEGSMAGFVAPMLISSPEYVVEQYRLWAESLTSKNAENLFSGGQNISLLGMVRKISGSEAYSDLWLILPEGVACMVFDQLSAQPLPQDVTSQVRCAMTDSRQRYWVSGRDDATLRLFDRDNQLLGYLTPQGRLSKGYASFGSPIYCMLQTADGTILLGSKPDGLMRLRETATGTFDVERMKGALPCDNVYDMKEDSHERVWVATMGAGVVMLGDVKTKTRTTALPETAAQPGSEVRFIHITDDDIMLAATTTGLLVGRLPADGSAPQLILHRREAERAGSLACNATMDVLETSYQATDEQGKARKGRRIFVSTESGGISEIISSDLTAPQLEFRHYNRHNGLNSDVVLSLTEIDGKVVAVSNNQLLTLCPDSADGATGGYEQGFTTGFYDQGFFHRRYRFSEMHPCRLPDGRWLFGLMDGAIALAPGKMGKSVETPRIALTGIDRHREGTEYVESMQDTITLLPGERDVTITFATPDFRNPASISYAFRMEGDREWNYIGHSHTTTLASLKPGTYRLQLRSTNADGVWVQNMRTLTVIVQPTFWEAWYGQLLIILAVALLLATAIYTYIYIRRIRRQQQETLAAYLALIETRETGVANGAEHSDTVANDSESSEGGGTSERHDTPTSERRNELSPQDHAFMERVMHYVEEHIGDADANTDAMAEAAAASRSVLFRKMKSIVGLTPADFLREARIKRACQLLATTQKSVAEVAYSCGFSDPKYFGKCFRASIGCSPTEYRNN